MRQAGDMAYTAPAGDTLFGDVHTELAKKVTLLAEQPDVDVHHLSDILLLTHGYRLEFVAQEGPQKRHLSGR
jgi:hypothetical protein